MEAFAPASITLNEDLSVWYRCHILKFSLLEVHWENLLHMLTEVGEGGVGGVGWGLASFIETPNSTSILVCKGM